MQPSAAPGNALTYAGIFVLALAILMLEVGPTLALAVLLGGLISFTGVGNPLSARVTLAAARWTRLYPLLPALLVALVSWLALPTLRLFQDAAVPARIAVSLGILLLPGLAMGLCFRLGLRLCERMEFARTGAAPRLGPWSWGINLLATRRLAS